MENMERENMEYTENQCDENKKCLGPKVICKPIEPSDVPELAAICKGTFREAFHITEEKITDHLFFHPEFSAEASRKLIAEETGEIIGFIGVKISGNQELYPNTAWISLFAVRKEQQKKGYGRQLLSETCAYLTEHGICMIYVGMDFENFFSGIPDPDGRKEMFFRKSGFALNADSHYDLEADITQNALIENYCHPEFEREFVVTTYRENREELIAFLEREFPGRWVYEAKEAVHGKGAMENVVLLWNKERTEVVGYCMLSVDANGYGGLGPIGIAQKIRGRHVGDYLLNESLRQAKRIGAKRVNIDWTILKDFYGQFGFKPERTYRAAFYEREKVLHS